jgi:hypothetical protein
VSTMRAKVARARRVARVAAAMLAAAMAGCGVSARAPTPGSDRPLLPDDPVTSLVGELHLHQFPLGSHAWAAFIAEALPTSAVRDDQLIQLDQVPTATAGLCTLWRRPVCTPACQGGAYCAGTDLCRTVPPVLYVDGGPIAIRGSLLQPLISLVFTAADTGYQSTPPPGRALLFGGGEVLDVEGGQGPYRLAGALPAPTWLSVSQPDLGAPLHVPTTGPLELRWDAGTAALVVILVNASRSDGDYGVIRCVGPDSGSATVPAELLAGLPSPPRDNRIEIERDNELILKTVTPGVGIYTHAAFSAWAVGSD